MKTLSFGNKLAFLSQFYFHVLDDYTENFTKESVVKSYRNLGE